MSLPTNDLGNPATSLEKVRYMQYYALTKIIGPARTALEAQKSVDARNSRIYLGFHPGYGFFTSSYDVTNAVAAGTASGSMTVIDNIRATADTLVQGATTSLIANYGVSAAIAQALHLEWDNRNDFNNSDTPNDPATTIYHI